MNRLSHVFVALIILVLICQHSLGVKMKRPNSFKSSIMGNGNDGKFKNIKSDIVKNSQGKANGLTKSKLDLAHVFPWAAIDACVDAFWVKSKQSLLNRLVKVIFEEDQQAVVPKAFKDNPNKPNEFEPDSTSIIKHTAYLGPALRAENKALRTKAQATCKPTPNLSTTSLKNQRACKELLHNAPANLRYGVGVPNRNIIGDRLDFMGKNNGFTLSGKTRGLETKKEAEFRDFYEECYDDIDDWCEKQTRKYCETDNKGNLGIRSSSSPYKIVY